jgi:hypothetical protein
MILKFPDIGTLRLALTSGAIPADVSAATVTAGENGGGLWVECERALPRAALSELKRLGVETVRSAPAALTARASCWAELLPVTRDASPPELSDRAVVLFELQHAKHLADLVSELLRLANDRQSYRWLEDTEGSGHALLRVVGPPYYSLLRALDRIGGTDAPLAFIERAPRVWIEIGSSHPLAEQLKPPEGSLLLLQSSQPWRLLPDGPFRDIYEILEFSVPSAPTDWTDAPLRERLRLPLSLRPGAVGQAAEFWVLKGDGVDELDRFVRNADERLLHRLAFAVGRQGERTTVVVRVRQSRQAPPVLVLNAEAYSPYLKIPNLFLLAGTRLHPPLRRDVVRRLLAADENLVTWLEPGPDGAFTPQNLPENAFRPLADWVEYVLSVDHVALDAWVESSRFEFDRFICDDDPKPKPRGDRDKTAPGGRDSKRKGIESRFSSDDSTSAADDGSPAQATDEDIEDVLPAAASDAEIRLRLLEERFLQIEGGLDAAERAALWPGMAALNAALGNKEDAALSWQHHFWSRPTASSDQARAWFDVEAAAVAPRVEAGWPKGRSWTSRATLSGARGRAVPADDLDLVLSLDEPAAADAKALAAYIVYAATRTPVPQEVVDRLDVIHQFLAKHEALLPVRAVWLARVHLARLAGGDVLGLARTRDRLLARLFSGGLRPEMDMPAFLRFEGSGGRDRARVTGNWLGELRTKARDWATRQGQELLSGKDARTEDYIDLFFAFAFARLGEADASRRLVQRASLNLAERDDAHQLLLAGLRYRIDRALAGQAHGGPLPPEQLEYVSVISKDRQPHEPDLRYIVERMRYISRILEPDQQIDPYRHVYARTKGDLASLLAALPDMLDPAEVTAQVHLLLTKPPIGAANPEARAQILRAGLDEAPRVGDAFARQLLDLFTPIVDAALRSGDLAAIMRRAELLERALLVAAHFDIEEHVPHLIANFRDLLGTLREASSIEAVELLARRCFRGLRKLGLRDDIDRLLTLMADVVLRGEALPALERRTDKAVALRTLLHVAGGWFYFGRGNRAEAILKAARKLLFSGELVGKEGNVVQHTSLACAYAAALGEAPAETARPRLEEIFAKLNGVRDVFATCHHYCQSQLRVVEAVLLAVVTDDLNIGQQARRWLDDDEFIVRRRIHRDVRELMAR